jgi:hypothetical protein
MSFVKRVLRWKKWLAGLGATGVVGFLIAFFAFGGGCGSGTTTTYCGSLGETTTMPCTTATPPLST